MRASTHNVPRIEVKCQHCGKKVLVTPSKFKIFRYCSRACKHEGQKVERRLQSCESCETVFAAMKDHGAWPRFCSRECFYANKHRKISKPCETCGKTFVAAWKKNHYKKFCSVECAAEGKKRGSHVECDMCGELHYRRPSGMVSNHHFCSCECKHQFMIEEACGAAYQGGVTWHAAGYWMRAGERVVVNTKGHRTKVRYHGEHRLIAGAALGRKLRSDEPVWHINRDREDNRLSNLYVFPSISAMWSAIMNDQYPTESNIPVDQETTA